MCSAQVLLLMATAMDVSILEPPPSGPGDALTKELRVRQQRIAEITEMIHVSSVEFYAYIKWFSAIFC
jgi:geranyl diphosphate synthase